MKNSVLLELARRWEEDARQPAEEPSDMAEAAKNRSRRETLRECADGLRMLSQLLPDD